MSERKVLNKYYPPDFDPSKIPRMKLPKNRQYTVRLMAPFNMRCTTCGEYIYKGKKFNARKEDVENETYLGIRIYRFYIKCTRCLQEISFKTDPQNTDYEIEAGATRNFMALKLAEEQAIREEKEAREEEANNPMKLLENRTQQSRNEIEVLESLEELKDLNRRQHIVNYDEMLSHFNRAETEEERQERIKREDEAFIKSVTFRNKSSKGVVAEEIIEEIVEEDEAEDSKEPPSKMQKPSQTKQKPPVVVKPTKSRNPLSNLVKLKSQLVKPIASSGKDTSTDPTSSLKSEMPSSSDKTQITSTSKPKPDLEQGSTAAQATPKNALNMLAAYSDSSENSD